MNQIEEIKKARSRWELNMGHLACAASALLLRYNNRTINSSQSSTCITNLYKFMPHNIQISIFKHEAR